METGGIRNAAGGGARDKLRVEKKDRQGSVDEKVTEEQDSGNEKIAVKKIRWEGQIRA